MYVQRAEGVPVLRDQKYIPALYASKLLIALYATTVLAVICNTDYEGEIKNFGDTVHIRTLPDAVIRDYYPGQNLQYTSATPGHVDLTIDHAKYWAIPFNDLDKKQSDIPYVNKWADHFSQELRQVVDRHVLGTVYADAHADNAGTTAGAISGGYDMGALTAPVGLTKSNVLDFIVDAGSVLDEQNVPDDGRWMILPTWAVGKVKKSDIKDASLAGDAKSVLRTGLVGQIDRFTVYKSNNLEHVSDTLASGGTSVTACNALFGHKMATTFAQQLVKTETLRNPNDFGDLMRSLYVYGFGVVKPEALGHAYIYPASDAA